MSLITREAIRQAARLRPLLVWQSDECRLVAGAGWFHVVEPEGGILLRLRGVRELSRLVGALVHFQAAIALGEDLEVDCGIYAVRIRARKGYLDFRGFVREIAEEDVDELVNWFEPLVATGSPGLIPLRCGLGDEISLVTTDGVMVSLRDIVQPESVSFRLSPPEADVLRSHLLALAASLPGAAPTVLRLPACELHFISGEIHHYDLLECHAASCVHSFSLNKVALVCLAGRLPLPGVHESHNSGKHPPCRKTAPDSHPGRG